LEKDGLRKAVFIPGRGAICTSLTLPAEGVPRECLYLPETFPYTRPADTYGGWPVLFPICGRLKRNALPGYYRYENQTYCMPIHGFASRLPWQAEARENGILMTLQDTAETRKQYPFGFVLSLFYRFEADTFCCTFTCRNTGDTPLPFSIGFHPYLLIDSDNRAATRVHLQPVQQIRYTPDLSDVTNLVPPGRFPAPIDTLNECGFTFDIRPSAALEFAPGKMLTLSAPTPPFRYMHFYTRRDEPFFCMEPWSGLPNALNSMDGPTWLAAGASCQGTVQLRH
jgi:galactose mutarotase-like enzyme